MHCDSLPGVKLDFAPMEGISCWPLRRVLFEFFPGADRCYTPFIAANSTHSLKTREKKETDPGHNAGIPTIPQVLTNDPGAFLWAAEEMAARGYPEVNFNLGCPSPTVVTHGKGSGMLADPDRLMRFFDAVFEGLEGKDFFRAEPGKPGIRVSVKTRVGMDDEGAAEALAVIFGSFPFSRVIVHPRLRTDYYRGEPRKEIFRLMYGRITLPVAYNGNITTVREFRELVREFPRLESVMIGRGVLMNPALMREIRGGPPLRADELRLAHERLLSLWLSDIPEFSGVIGKMKELWYYLGPGFENAAKPMKRIRKSRTEAEYRAAVSALFDTCPLLPEEERTWRP